MKKVDIEDVIPIKEYIKVKNEYTQKILKIKALRRIHLGHYFTFLFENTETILYQIQEMLRIESITDQDGIIHEIDTYNRILPKQGELSATMLIEINDPQHRSFKLKELLGLQEHVYMNIENKFKIKASFDEKQFNQERVSSVQFIRFTLNKEQENKFLNTQNVEILSEHPAYNYSQPIDPEKLAALKEDLQGHEVGIQ